MTDILQMTLSHFMGWQFWGILIRISLMFFPEGPIGNKLALVQVTDLAIRRQAITRPNDGTIFWMHIMMHIWYASLKSG